MAAMLWRVNRRSMSPFCAPSIPAPRAMSGRNAPRAPPARSMWITIDLAGGARGAFRPDMALGAGIDGAQKGDIDRLFTRHNIAAMRRLGLRSFTYRLRTELGIE